MIAGLVNQAGPKDDRLAQNILPQPQAGFEIFLSTTREPKSSAPSLAKTVGNTGPDVRLRKSFLRDPDQEDPIRREDRAEPDRETQQLLSKATPSAYPIQKAPDPAPPPPTEEAEAPDVPSKALQRRGGAEQPEGSVTKLPSQIGQPGMVAQTGLTAYRLAAHGLEEALFAERAGAIPLGETLGETETLGAEADKLDNSVLFAKPPAKPAGESEGEKPLTALDVLNLSRKAAAPTPQLDESFLTEAELETAQARSELLTKLMQRTPGEGQANAATVAVASGLTKGQSEGTNPLEKRSAADTVLKPATEKLPIPGLTLPVSGAQASKTLAKTPAEVQGQEVVERIAQQARWLIRNNRNEVTFRLQPEHLGEVKLKISQVEGRFTVEMTVDNPAVKRMVESQLDNLQQRLQEENLASGQFEFNVDVRQGGDTKNPEIFALTPPANSLNQGEGQTEAPNPNSHVDRLRPVWGQSGSGIYA